MDYIGSGLKRETALSITGITKHQYYYKPRQGSPGAKPTNEVIGIENGKRQICFNETAIQEMKKIQINIEILIYDVVIAG
jgi:hypothetical protein